jgi:hypothetical protein
MGRIAILVLLVCAAVGSSALAGAERQCADDVCVTLAWPERALDLSGSAALQALLGEAGLSAEERAAAAALAQRRLGYRIRGLELRYLVGKTAASTSDPSVLEPIRHQIDAIDQEIAFIDQRAATLLAAHARRTGPWLVRAEENGEVVVWFVAAPPCGTEVDLAFARGDAGDRWEVDGEPDTDAPQVDIAGACVAWRMDAAGPSPWFDVRSLRVRSGLDIWRFVLDD